MDFRIALLAISLTGCSTTSETDTTVDGLWCFGLCQRIIASQNTDRTIEAKEPEKEE